MEPTYTLAGGSRVKVNELSSQLTMPHLVGYDELTA